MKTKFTLKIYREAGAFISLFVVLASFNSCSVVENAPSGATNKAKFSRKERNVKIYPDIIKRVIHLKNIEDAPLDFFVFDLEGTLVIHYKMKEGDRKNISGLERGSYVYQVFKGDEMRNSGKLNIK